MRPSRYAFPAALLCAANSADAVRVVTHETDAEDGELSVDTLTFSRADQFQAIDQKLRSRR